MTQDRGATEQVAFWSWPLRDWDVMWKPSTWLRKPPTPHKAHLFHLLAIVGLASYANVIANKVLSDVWHIPFNLGVLAVALFIGRRAGTSWTSMGLRGDRVRRGTRVGLLVMGVIAVGVVLAIAIPSTREIFKDDRVIEHSLWWALAQALIRIPIATAFYEEVLFRGIVFGMLVRRNSPLIAALWTSLLFGFWHILPTIDTLKVNPAGDLFSGIAGFVIAIVGAVGGTMLAGLAFLWIRLYANSTAASILAHIGTNSLAMLGAVFVVHVL